MNTPIPRSTLAVILPVLFVLVLPPAAAQNADKQGTVLRRVKGETEKTVRRKGDRYQFGKFETGAALPNGYPRPTPPGIVELKTYPRVRKAAVDMSKGSGDFLGFSTLFLHIKTNGIPMTAPVQETYQKRSQGKKEKPSWQPTEMAFLYRTTEQGETGKQGLVRVTDQDPVTVLSIGETGRDGASLLKKHVNMLKKWIREHPDWRMAGPPRTLGYNQPSKPNPWWEVQVPVKRTKKEEKQKER